MKKLETFDSIYFRGKSHFEDDSTQKYLVFQTVYRSFKTVSANDSNILLWKSKVLPDESIEPPSTCNKMFSTSVDYASTKVRVKFNVNSFKQSKVPFDHGKIKNIYFVYEKEKVLT